MSLLLATRLEYHLNSITVNANHMRGLFIGPSWGRPGSFSWAVSINGANEHYTGGFGSPPALIGSHSRSVVFLFSIHACVLPVLLPICPPTPPIFAIPAYPCTWSQPLTHFIMYASPLIYKHLHSNSFIKIFEINITKNIPSWGTSKKLVSLFPCMSCHLSNYVHKDTETPENTFLCSCLVLNISLSFSSLISKMEWWPQPRRITEQLRLEGTSGGWLVGAGLPRAHSLYPNVPTVIHGRAHTVQSQCPRCTQGTQQWHSSTTSCLVK